MEHLSIGICTPTICTPEEALKTGYPCTAELNPFTYGEREAMIRAALTEEGIEPNKYTILPFPSDYANIEDLVQKDTVFLLSSTSQGDQYKKEHLENRGYTVETIMSLPFTQDRESGEHTRGNPDWKEHVHPAIATYIEENGLSDRLSKS